ncbi:hypothetical protein [Sphingobacterium sp. JB170]|uniref:hypothetical protein n=1 Tax=Sphingobacterium sp. JB170 TaxID=1434842 RepID=UPI00097F38C1|nr:hypothetical protein [Sphingobacterium sp. JB170]SJN49842.1 hypothetical protein FM107_19320 [Sphingobacterium sp. JB170]
MRNLKISQRVMMFALALIFTASFSAYTFAQRPAEGNLALVWFPTDEAGNIDKDNPMSAPPADCSTGTAYCAVSFNQEDLTSEGDAPIDNASQDPDQLIQETTRKASTN